ncbi:hypothetical protein GGI07_000202 [Coemansia sp. Benny D115]|nr:hypothetical protein GGI07_000202 [Coemansia sp. Benny D115]
MRKADSVLPAGAADGAAQHGETPADAASAGLDTTGNDMDEDDDDENDDADEQEGDDESLAKMPRLMRACDHCRRKKVKCNGIKPSCSHCTRMKLACHYSPLVRKKRVRRTIIDKLEERLESMEQMLQPLVERLSPNDPVVSAGIGGFGLGFGFAPAPAPAIAHPLGLPIPAMPNGFAYGGPAPGAIPPPMFGLPRELAAPPLSPSTGPPLPPLPIIEELMEIALARMSPVAPPVSWNRLLRRLHSGQLPEFIVCATIALGARFSNRPEFACTPRYNAGREYAKRAAELISTLVDRPDPDVVYCMAMLSLYEWGCGRGESAWSYTGMATRLAQRCRLHLVDEEDFNENVDDQPHTWANTEWRRRLWWVVYCGDRTSVIVASRPATVHDDDCVVDLPTHDYEWVTGTVPPEEQQPSSTGTGELKQGQKLPDCWWMIVELYRICSRISEFANRRRRPVRSGDIPRRTMFEILDRDLEDLRARFIPGIEFPLPTEWLLSGHTNLRDGLSNRGNICAVFFSVHLMYYAAKIILYRSELPDYLHESIAPELIDRAKCVCIDAAHKQSDIIRWALDNIPIEDWDPKVGVWSLQGASIHVNAALSSDNAIAEQSRRDLEVHLKLHVASDQYYHFNMAIITMLHHVFNLRKKQCLAITNVASGLSSSTALTTKEPQITIDHENDSDPWIVPRCSSFLGFTYNYSQLRGILNEAIKQTTYGPPETLKSDGELGNSTGQPLPITHANDMHISQQQQQQQHHAMSHQMHSYHLSLGGHVMPNSDMLPLVHTLDNRRMSTDTHISMHQPSLGGLDLSGGLWHPQATSPLSATNSAGFDQSGLLPNAINNNGFGAAPEGMGFQQQPHHVVIGSNGPAPPQTAEDPSNSQHAPRSIKRAYSNLDKMAKASAGTASAASASAGTASAASAAAAAAKEAGGTAAKGKGSGRGRKSNNSAAQSASGGDKQQQQQQQSSGANTQQPLASTAKTSSGAQQIEQLQRLEELRARVVLLQQLSGQQNNGGNSMPNMALSMAQQHQQGGILPSSNGGNPAALASSVSEGGGKDVNGFLNSFAASIGSMASQLGSSGSSSANKPVAAASRSSGQEAAGGGVSSPSSHSIGSTSPPPHQNPMQHMGLSDSTGSTWLAGALSQQMNITGAPASDGTMQHSAVGFPSMNTAITTDNPAGSFTNMLGADDLQMLMAQHFDGAGNAFNGLTDASMGFQNGASAAGAPVPPYQPSTADLQGLMQRLTTFNASQMSEENRHGQS